MSYVTPARLGEFKELQDKFNESKFLKAHPTVTTTTDTTSTETPDFGGTVTVVDSVARDSNGHTTVINTKTITLPSYSNATSTTAGLMSAEDKQKLDNGSIGASVVIKNWTVGDIQ